MWLFSFRIITIQALGALLDSSAPPFGVSQLQLPHREFQASAISRDIDTAAKLMDAGAASVGVAGSGAGIGKVSVSIIIGDAKNPSEKQQPSSDSNMETPLSVTVELTPLQIAFLILFAM